MSITEPGLIADLQNADYHADKEWLSSTVLKRALPEYTEPDDDTALVFGSFFHSVVLEPDTLDDLYVLLDPATVGVTKDGSPSANPLATTAWKTALAEAKRSGKTVVSPADWERAHRMADKVHEHQTAASLLFSSKGTNEESAFWIDDAGLKHKARFDRRISGAVIDLKSTSTRLTNEKLAEATANYLYDLSAAHYLAVAEGLGLDVNAFAFVFVSKAAPYHVKVVDLDDAFLYDGRLLRERAIDLTVNGQRGFTTLTPPRWRRIEGVPA